MFTETNAPSGTVMTVTGPVRTDDLGHVQPHEHVFGDISWVEKRWDVTAKEDEVQMTEEVARYRAAGGNTLFDMTCGGMQRKPEALRRVSERTGVHIVMGTGWYRAPYYPPELDTYPTARLAEVLVDEILNGVDGTDVKPGIIGEIGIDQRWVQGLEERVLRAVARAHRRTGLAISTHTSPHSAPAFYEVFAEERADPSRIAFGHCDNTLELDYLEAVLATGAYVQFDLIGIESINSDARRVSMLVELLRRGHEDRLLLSLDFGKRPRFATNGGHGLAYLIDGFLPQLREAGVGDDTIDHLTQTNPQRLVTVP